MMGKPYFVYIVTNRKHGALYTGVTNDIVRRTSEHRVGLPGFARTHGCKHLVWFEVHEDINEAIVREKRVKQWQRAWKDRLIEEANPDWRDLWWDIIGPQPVPKYPVDP